MFDVTLKVNIHLKASKYHFYYPKIEFVGYLVGAHSIRMMSDKITKINKWPVLSNKIELQSFLNLAGYYYHFVKDFTEKAFLLNKLIVKSTLFEWQEIHQEAFEQVKKMLISALILYKPNYEQGWILEVDVSDIMIGAVLVQEQEYDHDIHPVYFWSR